MQGSDARMVFTEKKKKKVICDPDGSCPHRGGLHEAALLSLRTGFALLGAGLHQCLHTLIEVHVKDFHVGISRWRPCDFFALG